jgi:hypothetical protein
MSSFAPDKAFWQSLASNEFAIPEGHSVQELTPALVELLGSPDPELRDDVAYTALVYWVTRQQLYSDDELRQLTNTLRDGLYDQLIENPTNSVLRRSFSALALSVLAYHDLTASFWSEDDVHALVETACDYLLAEQDVRGYHNGTGWRHAVAHTADLMKFLARNPKSSEGDHLRMLNTMAERLMKPVAYVYIHDEDERLTQAVTDILKRRTLTDAVLIGWMERIRDWKQEHANSGNFDPLIHAPYMNLKTFIRSVYLMLQMLAQQDEHYRPLEQEAQKVVRFYGMGTIYVV